MASTIKQTDTYNTLTHKEAAVEPTINLHTHTFIIGDTEMELDEVKQLVERLSTLISAEEAMQRRIDRRLSLLPAITD